MICHMAEPGAVGGLTFEQNGQVVQQLHGVVG